MKSRTYIIISRFISRLPREFMLQFTKPLLKIRFTPHTSTLGSFGQNRAWSIIFGDYQLLLSIAKHPWHRTRAESSYVEQTFPVKKVDIHIYGAKRTLKRPRQGSSDEALLSTPRAEAAAPPNSRPSYDHYMSCGWRGNLQTAQNYP